MSAGNPQVSVLIPAYNEAFFEKALTSAVNQGFGDMEIIVSDDSCASTISTITERVADGRVRYTGNSRNLGFSGNFTQCFNLARGRFVKFLNDDDILHPQCIERMVASIREADDVSLVTSKRRIIDADGRPQKDTVDTMPLSGVDALVKGLDVGNLLLQHSINFVGEPTTVMFRKSALNISGNNIFRLCGHDYTCLADVSLWLRLLSAGRAVYLADELSYFRVHAGQEQKKPAIAVKCITERYTILADARSLGFLQEPHIYARAINSVLGIYKQALSSGALSNSLKRDLSGDIRKLQEELAALQQE